MKQKNRIIYCIHGNSSSSNVFNSLKYDKTINEKIIANDLPGHGENQYGYEDSDFTIESYKKLLTEDINSYSSDILLIGNSLGGHLAIEIANNIHNLKGLIIMGTPPVKKPLNFEEAFVPSPTLNTFLKERPTLDEIKSTFKNAVVNRKKLLVLIESFKKTNPAVRKIIADDIMQNKLGNEFEIFTNLKIPTYIISGQQDYTVNRTYLRRCTEASNNCEFVDVENCGHYPIDCEIEFNKIVKRVYNSIFI